MFFSTLFFFMVLCFLPNKAHAYLDPGTGSYFLQVAMAALVGGAFFTKSLWIKVKLFLKKILSR